MTDNNCPFCSLSSDRIFYESRLTIGIRDGFPVSPGHLLIIPRRHFADWFDATPDEQREILDALAYVKTLLAKEHNPDGYNIGINIGEAAGQTVFHLHVHLIPRYKGDVADPTGGVRYVIPSRANYRRSTSSQQLLELPHPRSLIEGAEHDPLLPHLQAHMDRAVNLDMAVSFIQESGLKCIIEHLRDILGRGGRVRVLTGDYLGITDPQALAKLLDLSGNLDLRVFEAGPTSFHPKSYIVYYPDATGIAFVGSSNLSEMALNKGVEWNYRVISSENRRGFDDVVRGFESLFRHPHTKPLDQNWVSEYAKRRVVPAGITLEVPIEKPEPPPKPHRIQQEALAALDETRRARNKAGLVVLATGLGKTWLAAFDSGKPEYKKVLFVAHREEILKQAMSTFRRIRPLAKLGMYTGTEKVPEADVLFASIQTLGKKQQLQVFPPKAFDYIVVDEFHHAAASSYMRLIEYFEPQFLLGLTATPERTDGGDLLALCDENLVYRCDMIRGIQENLLCPFHYVGIPDKVDYANIPWRSSRFDETALTNALATQARAENAYEQYQKHGGRRTLAFCCSMKHADFMSEYFKGKGVHAASVHSGPMSAPRATAIDKLGKGELQIIFTVDIFNEGLDVPNIDTVMMLRPTESPIIWLQQFGRGLRRFENKTLRVIDYIGNHRTFLIKPRTLLGINGSVQDLRNALRQVQMKEFELPPGCEITYELETIEILQALLRLSKGEDVIKAYYDDFKERHGIRPTATELFHAGYMPQLAKRTYDSWLGFVAHQGDLSQEESSALQESKDFLKELEVTSMTRSFKMLVLKAMLNLDRLPGSISLEELTGEVAKIAGRSAQLRADFGVSLEDKRELADYLKINPINAWTGDGGKREAVFFRFDGTLFRSSFDVKNRASFQDLARELVEWRLAQYLSRLVPKLNGVEFRAKVSHSSGRPILFLPKDKSLVPSGLVTVLANHQHYVARFMKEAVNVMSPPNEEGNVLPEILFAWFGPNAGKSGTHFHVVFRKGGATGEDWIMEPGNSSVKDTQESGASVGR